MKYDLGNSDDVYLLGTREHSGLSLVSVSLTLKNYLLWSQNVVTSLEAKRNKVFLFWTLPRPKFGEPNYVRWGTNDAMFRVWIRNSISPECQSTFAYVTSCKDLWNNLREKYGQKNDILLSKLINGISNLKQGAMSVTEYYSKLHKLMSELQILESSCNCKRED